MSNLKLTVIGIIFLFFMTESLMVQDWKECSGIEWNYDLSGKRILTVIYEGFNYDEAIDISNYWKKWGATPLEMINPVIVRPVDEYLIIK